MAAGGAHLHDPAGAARCLADVLWSLFGPQCPVEVSAVAFLLIGCRKRDVAFSLKLTADLTMQSLLVRLLLLRSLRLHRQEEVGPLLLELSKKWWLGVQRICLDQHPLQIELAHQLLEDRPLVVFAGGVAGLTDRNAQSS